MIKIINLEKKYSKENIQALNSINAQIYDNEIFGIVGPDGAGKTTLLRIMLGLIKADKGEIIFDALNIHSHLNEIRFVSGYMPGKFSLYQELSVQENLNFFSKIFNVDLQKSQEIIEPIWKQIYPFKDRQAGKLSGGMKQKLALCCALINNPKYLILDEPSTGVDAVSRKEFWLLLKKIQNNGVTIVVSTPYMDEAYMCDRIAFIDKGSIFDIDTPQNIIENYPYKLYEIKASKIFKTITVCREYNFVQFIVRAHQIPNNILKEYILSYLANTFYHFSLDK